MWGLFLLTEISLKEYKIESESISVPFSLDLDNKDHCVLVDKLENRWQMYHIWMIELLVCKDKEHWSTR